MGPTVQILDEPGKHPIIKTADLRASGLLGLFLTYQQSRKHPHFNQHSWYLQCPVLRVQKNELVKAFPGLPGFHSHRPEAGAVVKVSKFFTMKRGVKAAGASTWVRGLRNSGFPALPETGER